MRECEDQCEHGAVDKFDNNYHSRDGSLQNEIDYQPVNLELKR